MGFDLGLKEHQGLTPRYCFHPFDLGLEGLGIVGRAPGSNDHAASPRPVHLIHSSALSRVPL